MQDVVALETEGARAVIARHGAETLSWTVGGQDLLWCGDPTYWPRRAPLLFPVVGASTGGDVRVDGRVYPMPRHGFARDSIFEFLEHDAATVRLRLEDSAQTRHHYPFAFRLDVSFSLRVRRKITESPVVRGRSIAVMAGEGSPSRPCFAYLGKAVDGRPAPAMTSVGRAAPPEALIPRRPLGSRLNQPTK
jgi:hypothetical protein